MFRYKWHVLVMLLLSMVGFSMVNAFTFNVENRDPFGTLNLSELMIKPNANSDSTIELSGNTLQIKTSEGNTGTIRVGLVCNENGTSCKDVQTLLKYADIEWGQVPIGLGNPEHVLFPKNTGSNIWVGKLSNLEREEESEYKLRVVGKTRLEGDLLVTGGNITVYQICDENNNCKKVSELYTGNGAVGGGDTYWHIHTYDPEYEDATVLYPNGLYNVWIGNPDPMPAEANPYKLRVLGKTKLDGDLLVTGGNITVYEICDETGKCKKVSELYTGNGVGGGGGDVYWQLNGDILSTSGGSYGVNLNSNLNVAGSLNAGNLNTRGLNVTGNFNFAWENDEHGYNTVSTTKASLHVGSSLSVAHDFTSNGTITAKGNITVSGGQVRVNEICDKGGENCRTVSQITTGNNYWKIKNNTRNLTMSVDNYGLSLSTQYQAGTPQEYSFAIMDGSITKGKLKIGNVGVDLRGNTTLNNALTVKGNANLQSGLTVTGGTTLNNDLTVKGNANLQSGLTVTGGTTLNNDLTVEGNSTLKNITSNGTTTLKGHLDVKEWAQFYNGLSIETGNLTVSGSTHLKSGLDVYKDANMYDGLAVSLRMGSLYQPVFRVVKYNGTPTVAVDGVAVLRGDTTISGNVAITGGKLTVNTVVSARTGTNYEQNMQPKILSSIRLMPAGTGYGNNNWENIGNIGATIESNLYMYTSCDERSEGSIMYYRKYNNANLPDNRKLLGQFVGCVCDYKIASSTFDCEWEVIASK